MVNKQLVSYIKEQLKSGYDINSIRTHLINYGYNANSVEEAIHNAYHKFPIIPIIFFIFAIAVVFGAFLFLRQPAVPEKLLDLETTSLKNEVEPGGELSFNVQISNMGTSNAFDVMIQHVVLDYNRNIITSKQESLAVLTKASSKSQITIPYNTLDGDYTLETKAYYGGKTAKSSFMFKVVSKQIEIPAIAQETNKTKPSEIPQGVPLEQCPVNCDDMNDCTIDICNPSDPFICKHALIKPCCGNKECEDQENYKVCAQDCEAPEIYKEMTKEEIISTAEQKAKENPSDAVNFCNQVKDINNRDECYKTVAYASGSSSYCTNIISDTRRDMCYGYFASKGDLSVCSKMINEYMKDSCNALIISSVQ